MPAQDETMNKPVCVIVYVGAGFGPGAAPWHRQPHSAVVPMGPLA
jgi:hypothetical protein